MLLRKTASLSLSFLILLSTVFSYGTVFGAKSSDISGHWAEQQLTEWIANGYIKAYSDGSYKPDKAVTRAEFLTMINRSFGFVEEATFSFKDVASSSSEYAEIGKALKAGYISGYTDNTIRPSQKISRQEAAKMIFNLLKLKADNAQLALLNDFKDSNKIAAWSKPAVAAVAAKGLMKGYEDGTYRPEGLITRAEAVVSLSRAYGAKGTAGPTAYDKAGTYGPASGIQTIDGDVIISDAGVTLQNVTVTGNLIFTEGIGAGDATLDHVTVNGTTTVKGGGENSIHFKDSVLLTIIVNKKDGTVRIVAEGTTTVKQVTLLSSAIVEEANVSGNGFANVEIPKELPSRSKVTLLGAFEDLDVYAKSFAIEVPKGTIRSLHLQKDAKDTSINLGKESKITALVLDEIVKVLGLGNVDKATINEGAKGSTFETSPKTISTGSPTVSTAPSTSIPSTATPAPTPAPTATASPAPTATASPTPAPSTSPTPAPTPQVPFNAAAGKSLTSDAVLMDATLATDGKADNTDLFTEAESGLKYIQIDFGASQTINSVYLWHYFGDGRTYHDVIVQLSDDEAFAESTTVFNNDTDGSAGLGTGTDAEYAETEEGKAISVSAVHARYLRVYSNGATKQNGGLSVFNHYVEVEAWTSATRPAKPPEPILSPVILKNAAAGVELTTNGTVVDSVYATDGVTDNLDLLTDAGSGLTYIQLDFGASKPINAVNLWHYYGDGRTYHDVIVQLSDDPAFAESTTVFNNDADGSAGLGIGTDLEYAETSEGKAISFEAVSGRYLRVYSNGSTKQNGDVNPYNHYIEVQAWAEPPAYRTNNVTFLNPEWVMFPRTDNFIQQTVNKMTSYQIKYQMIDVGFFDRIANTASFEDTVEGGAIDGTLDPAAYAELQHWVTVSRATNPDIELIGALSGNSFMHIQNLPWTDRNGKVHTPAVDKATMQDNIAAKAKYFVETFGLDGINIDFEPLRSGASANDYRALIVKVREAIGPGKHLSICGNPFPQYMPDNEIAQYGALLDMIIMMDYDTGDDTEGDVPGIPWPANPFTTDAESYQLAIKDNTIRISNALKNTNCAFIPLGVGVDTIDIYHPAYENSMNHSIAVNDAIAAGAKVAGSGVWWWEKAKDDAVERQQFIDYWINGNP
ncbi:S-layer homology domain-containing protein [Paenibacillus sp. FJAT-27812]|uniref:S-layer homology domain-containing protein n=1 Tax=Paenibacillus sp. FJAT-27812 TaxID=1684143 RepID=UPI0006A78734|nr:S-layer homology domain-containing protein [Paenibacillus sp. FJAT-27812]